MKIILFVIQELFLWLLFKGKIISKFYLQHCSLMKLYFMKSLNRLALRSFCPFALGASVAIIPGISFVNAASAQNTTFTDVESNYWARPFIERLAREDIIAGFPDGSFKPNQPVTRAQFAAIVRKAFNEGIVRNSRSFSDIPARYWAASAIEKAYTTGFMSGYPDNTFKPEQQIPKVQALVSLSSGLKLDPSGSVDRTLNIFRDGNEIPDYARSGTAAATQRNIVVNYPNRAYLNPNEVATRADIAAFIYQALVNKNEFKALPSRSEAADYIVTYQQSGTPTTGSPTTPSSDNSILARNTVLPVQYPGGNDVKLILTPGETISTNLELSSNILNSAGQVVIPQGSQVKGQFRPVSINGTTQGTQYYAESVTIGNRIYPINAISDPLVATSAQNLSTTTLKGGIASTAAQLLLSRVLGSGGGLDIGSLLGNLGGGTVQTAPTNSSVIVVEPRSLRLRVLNDVSTAIE
ncbi:S-layer homology domain-containing protein [Altericista sp. CCNU0014]|uniref:S-layer homology domain-containing protein n=1 Tax=Altericista sp. CCNU0014 TaxID=3082949 RepID=UPI003850BC32